MTMLAPFNVSFSASSPSFTYAPNRDGDVTTSWNASFTNSIVWPAGGADPATGNGFPYRRTQAASAAVSFTFSGSAIYFCITPDDATYSFQVDQVAISSTGPGTDAACKASGAQTVLFAENLDASAPHTAILTVAAATDREFRFFGGQATIGVTSGSQSVQQPTDVDDQNNAWIFKPGRGANLWDSDLNLVNSGLFGNSDTFSCINRGDQPQVASLPFTGAGGVILYGGIRVAHEFYTIQFNEKSLAVDASSQWHERRLVLFAQGGLDPNAQYTLAISNFNAQHPCTQDLFPCCVTIDEVVLLPPAPPDPAGVSGSSSPTSSALDSQTSTPQSSQPSIVPAVVGGVVGGFVVALIVIIIVFYLCRRRKRAAQVEMAIPSPLYGVGYPASMRPSTTGQVYMTESSHLPSGPFTEAGQAYFNRTSYMPSTVPPPASASTNSFSVTGSGGKGRSAASASAYNAPAASVPVLAPGAPGSASASDVGQSQTSAQSGQPGAHLGQEDLERVLAFVAQRMDRAPAAPHDEETLPVYHG